MTYSGDLNPRRRLWRAGFVVSVVAGHGVVGCGGSGSPSYGGPSGNSSGAASGSTGQASTGSGAGASGGTESGSSAGSPGGSGSGLGASGSSSGSASSGAPDAGAAEGSTSSGDAGLASDGGDGVTDPGTQGDGTVMLAQPFTPSPDVSDQPGVPKGQIIMFTMANSTTFNDGSRKVAVYVPAGYVSGTVVPFMVAQDGVTPQNGGSFGLDDLRPTMDNMIAAKQIPMMAGIFADPGGMRSVEYDTVSDKYYQFVETELLPAAVAQVKMQANLTLNLTTDPEGRGTFGGSSGGSAAFTMAWFHPESYRRILTISGSFVNLQSSPQYPDGAADYAYANTPNAPAAADQHLIVKTTPPKPLRVFLEAGTNDLGGGEWKAANDAMAPAFAMENYHYRYVVAQGATHEDDGARRDYLPDAMAWLWRGYPIMTP